MDKENNLSAQEYFDKHINIGYIDPSFPEPTNKQILKHYFCSALLYGLAVILFWFNKWYISLLTASIYGITVKELFTCFYFLYLIIAPIIYFSFRPKTLWNSNSILICNYVKRIFFRKPRTIPLDVEEIKNELSDIKPTYREGQAIILFLIKIFFGPQMLQYSANNINRLLEQIPSVMSFYNGGVEYIIASISSFRVLVWQVLINILFFIDVFIFAIGYLTESYLFKNKIRSVESSFFGILTCIACYIPFNGAISQLMVAYRNNNAAMFGDVDFWGTWVFRIIGIIFLFIYTAASVALFTKASNLTNRGTVSRWPYSVVRHPAYISKNIFWWMTTLPFFFVHIQDVENGLWGHLIKCILMFSGLIAWSTLYYFRAVTEERHLIKDPEYQEYVKKVKYRFIPGLF